jgi:hypothetical protein
MQAGSMRQRVVGNVMRILAVVTVGIAAEVPAVSTGLTRRTQVADVRRTGGGDLLVHVDGLYLDSEHRSWLP